MHILRYPRRELKTSDRSLTRAPVRVSTVWAAHAARDWDAILTARANELKPGGRMCIVNFCVDAQNQLLGSTNNIPRKMYDEMLRHWVAMRDEGRITTAEVEATALLMYYRTPDEAVAPLNDTSSRPYQAGLRLEDCHTAVTECPCVPTPPHPTPPLATVLPWRGLVSAVRTCAPFVPRAPPRPVPSWPSHARAR